uniref:hypothetical protein n=1 Tax=Nocardia cyriacigeorgica TaxID=135487 RepID=UPI00245532EF
YSGRPGEPLDPAPDADAVLEPFPMASMQHAFWIGRAEEEELGGVASFYSLVTPGGGGFFAPPPRGHPIADPALTS